MVRFRLKNNVNENLNKHKKNNTEKLNKYWKNVQKTVQKNEKKITGPTITSKEVELHIWSNHIQMPSNNQKLNLLQKNALVKMYPNLHLDS